MSIYMYIPIYNYKYMPRVASAGIAKRKQSAEALCLQARCFEPAPNPPNLQNLQNKPTRGRVYPPPTPSQTVRLARLLVLLASSWPS